MTAPHHVSVAGLSIGNDLPLVLIAGPCVMESRAHALETANALAEMATALGVGLIYKSSFDKANRTSASGVRGVGMGGALPIFAEIRETVGVPVITDVHEPGQCATVAEAVDVLQIPAFLCRQTDLLVAAAKTGRAINVKKGQFLAPWDMANVVEKIRSAGNDNVMVCERGASFGYNTLVSDMRALPILAQTGCPVVFDATHSVQQPGGQGQRVRRPARVRAGAGARGRVGGRRRGVHRDPPRPRPCAVRRAEHDPVRPAPRGRLGAARIRPPRQAPPRRHPLSWPTDPTRGAARLTRRRRERWPQCLPSPAQSEDGAKRGEGERAEGVARRSVTRPAALAPAAAIRV